MKVDACAAATMGLALVDVPRAASFGARTLLLALHAGEPRRVALAMTLEAAFAASARRQRRALRLLDAAEALATELGDAHLMGFVTGMRGVLLYEEARWRQAHETCDKAEALLRGRCTGVAWELRSMQLFSLSSLCFMGEMRAHAERLWDRLHDAEQRGDLYAITNFRTLAVPAVHLTAGDPVEARRSIREALDGWSRDGFYLQHMFALFTETLVDFYVGDGRRAHERAVRHRGPLSRSLLLHDRAVRTFWQHLRGGSAVLAAREGHPDRVALLRAARRDAERLERDGASAFRGMGQVLHAAVESARGRAEEARRRLQLGVEAFDEAEMSMYAASARWHLGRLSGGDEGATMLATADASIRAEGFVDPARLAASLAPGLDDDGR